MGKSVKVLKIQIGGLSEGVHQFDFLVPPADLALDSRFPTDVNVRATLDKTPNQVLLTAQIQTRTKFECDRCLAPFESELKPSYTMYYVVEGGEQQQIDPAEMQVIPPGLHMIDLTEDVRQTLLLAVPLKLLCSESCKGLCPECGTNFNMQSCLCSDAVVDVRWEPLKRILKN